MRRVSTTLVGLGRYVPETTVTSAEIESRLGLRERFTLPAGLIESLSGARTRHYVAPGECSSDLACGAARDALARAGVDPAELDVVIFASASHDVSEPATANILQDKLGARNAHVLDVKNACNSFVNALDIVDCYMQAGRCRLALVAAGEALSGYINWQFASLDDFSRGFSGLTLGDGGGAAVLRAEPGDGGRGIRSTKFASFGWAWELATIRSGGTMFPQDYRFATFESRSGDIAKFAIDHVPPVVRGFLDEIGWTADDIALVVPHQVSTRVTQEICRLTGLPFERCMNTIVDYGNTAAASIPMALADAIAAGRVGPNDRVLLAGGAAGYSVGLVAVVL